MNWWINIAWVSICLAHGAMSVRHFRAAQLAYKTPVASAHTSNYGGKQMLISSIPLAVFAVFLISGAVSLIVETPIPLTLLLAGLAILPIPVYANLSPFTSAVEEVIEVKPYGYYVLFAASIVVIVAGALLWFATDPPFVYDDGSITLHRAIYYDNGAYELRETDMYCAGESLIIKFDGYSNGRGAGLRVDGELQRIGGDDGRVTPEVDTFVFEITNREPSEPEHFNNVEFNGYTLPRTLQTGEYIWKHSVYSISESRMRISRKDGFVTNIFTVNQCQAESQP